VLASQPEHQVQLGADGNDRARFGLSHVAHDERRRSGGIGCLHYLRGALRVHDDTDPGILLPNPGDVFDGEAAVHATVTVPSHHQDLLWVGGLQRLVAAVPHADPLRGVAKGIGRVGGQVAVRGKKHSLAVPQPPGNGGLGIGRGADSAAVTAAEGLHCRAGVLVDQRYNRVRAPEVVQALPGRLQATQVGHGRHGAGGLAGGHDHRLSRAAQDDGTLRHEVHPAEHNVLGVDRGSDARQLQRVPPVIGELYDGVGLVMMGEDDCPRP